MLVHLACFNKEEWGEGFAHYAYNTNTSRQHLPLQTQNHNWKIQTIDSSKYKENQAFEKSEEVFFCSQYNFKLQQQIYFLLEFVRGQWPVLNVDIPFELSGSTGAESAAVKAIYRWGEPYTWTLSY